MNMYMSTHDSIHDMTLSAEINDTGFSKYPVPKMGPDF